VFTVWQLRVNHLVRRIYKDETAMRIRITIERGQSVSVVAGDGVVHALLLYCVTRPAASPLEELIDDFTHSARELRSARLRKNDICLQNPPGKECQEAEAHYDLMLNEYRNLLGWCAYGMPDGAA